MHKKIKKNLLRNLCYYTNVESLLKNCMVNFPQHLIKLNRQWTKQLLKAGSHLVVHSCELS